jgi:hypothetical protein
MGKMTGCDDCFYAQKDEEEFPCNICKGYDYYLHKDIYKEETDNKAWAKVVEGLNGLSKEDMPVKGDPHFYAGVHQLGPDFDDYDKEAYEKEAKEIPNDRFVEFDGRLWPKFELKQEHYDSVSKPKHYMLFDQGDVTGYAYVGKGIEVRDVIEKLVGKLPPMQGMTVSDYVQMMQYLMRFMDKNGVEDLEKARWYLDKIIQSLEDLKDY